MNPYASVLMSAYNAEEFIAEAIDSILGQSFQDFEFIIVDDCSQDSTRDIISKYSSADNRIRTIYNSSNQGQSISLNKGIEIAKGKYIARMDADDISLSHRLETQVDFMDSNIDIAVSSAWMETIGKEEGHVRKSSVTHEEIIAALFTKNCIWHPVAIIRKEILDSLDLRYDPDYVKGQDYKLWIELSRHYKIANIPEVLLKYRIHDKQKTRIDLEFKQERLKKLILNKKKRGIHELLLKDFLSREPTDEELILHAKLFFQIPFSGKEDLEEIQEWVDFLKLENRQSKKYIEPNFSNHLDDLFTRTKAKSFKYYTTTNKRFSPILLWKLFLSDEQYYLSLSKKELLYLTLNSLAFRKNRWYSEDK